MSSIEPDVTEQRDTPVVHAEAVSRTYTRGNGGGLLRRGSDATVVTALDGVSVGISRGELVGIAGPSGSGKSTLLHLLAALDTPTSGRVEIGGTNTATLSERTRSRLRRDHIGIVFQRFHLLPALTAQQNVALPFIEWGIGKRDRQERAELLLHRVGLGDRLTHRPAELSGGEQQRVAVARALAGEPDLLIADEPTGELDSEAGANVLDLLADVAEDRAVIVASHDQAVLDRVDRTIRLRDGHVVNDA
ncbi:ABC transporter ATP-binding protein [Halolamina sp. CBA1230]|uniref:ABC transporter ATP-binding protein n=1 Tax=Halolamina sp. CBA1230 TaxID=1853690 RepID=UPI0009A21759|nr:ABC transporter ATP-binding protein [Halolamina sp. CBA1230]QKY20481.1 ABC transporter ATP-binding protein [Halolamina sp. CBA1230]